LNLSSLKCGGDRGGVWGTTTNLAADVATTRVEVVELFIIRKNFGLMRSKVVREWLRATTSLHGGFNGYLHAYRPVGSAGSLN
jgi:hypothetical protein